VPCLTLEDVTRVGAVVARLSTTPQTLVRPSLPASGRLGSFSGLRLADRLRPFPPVRLYGRRGLLLLRRTVAWT